MGKRFKKAVGQSMLEIETIAAEDPDNMLQGSNLINK